MEWETIESLLDGYARASGEPLIVLRNNGYGGMIATAWNAELPATEVALREAADEAATAAGGGVRSMN